MDREYERFRHFTRERTRGNIKYPVTFTAENRVIGQNGKVVDRYLVEPEHPETGVFAFRLWQDEEGDFLLEKPDDPKIAWYLEPNDEFVEWCRRQILERFIA